MTSDINAFCIPPSASLREAICAIDRNEKGIVLVVDPTRRLLDTLTDGDVRRAMLAGVDLDTPVAEMRARRAHSSYPAPVTARVGTDREDLIELMQGKQLRHIPLVDEHDRVAGLVTLDELLPGGTPLPRAVVMAGGFGRRLHPLTEHVPKPMLPVGGRPLLELTLGKLQAAGIRRVNVATHFQADRIVDYFGNGEKFGLELSYVNEEKPLGTAGALGLMDRPTERLLVMNGDILTDIDFRAMLVFHEEHAADLTMAVRSYQLQVPYGVVECGDGARVNALREKPDVRVFVNAGIYLLEPTVYDCIASGERLDMTDLIERLLRAGRRVVSFPVREYWLDIGQHDDYLQAQEDFQNGLDRPAAARPRQR